MLASKLITAPIRHPQTSVYPLVTFERKIHADRCFVMVGKNPVHVAFDNARFARSNVAHDKNLEQMLLQLARAPGLAVSLCPTCRVKCIQPFFQRLDKMAAACCNFK